MGKILQISIYSVSLILVFLFFGSLLKSCGNTAIDTVNDTSQRVADNIENAGGEIVARAESAMGEEFEGGDVESSNSDSESKSYSVSSKKPDPVETTTTSTTSSTRSDDSEDYEPSYVVEDTPEPVKVAPVKVAPAKKEPVKAPVKKTTSSSSTSSIGSSSGRYLLITGNYSQEFNAEAMVKKLKNKGFSKAEHVIFEGSRYYTVIAGKYSSMNTANSAKSDLGNIDAYVQKRRD